MATQHVIGIAGVGKMGEALVRGLIVGRVVPASRILVSDAVPARAKEIAAKHGVTSRETVADLARESDLEAEEAAKPAGNPFDGIEVRPVREDVERHDVALDAFRAGPHERDSVDALFQAQTPAEEVDQVVVMHIDIRQGRLACHLAIYKIPREGKEKDGRRLLGNRIAQTVGTWQRSTSSESRAWARWARRSSGA